MRYGGLIAVLLGLGPGLARGVELKMQADRLSLRARDAPLTEVLREFVRSGVRVKLDPGVQRSVTADFSGTDVQKALEQILSPFSHVLTWKVIAGPLGAFPRLDEIQVFRPGQQSSIQPLAGAERRLAVAGGADLGPRYVKDEVLLGFRRGTRREDALRLLQQLGGTIVGSTPALGVYQVRFAPGTAVPDTVTQLAKNPLISGAEPNYVTGIFAPVPYPATGGLPASGTIPVVPAGAPAVAVLDSGLSPTAELGDAVRARYDATQPDQPLTDTQGHGTQMAMIASGAVVPFDAATVSAGAPVVAIRIFDDNGLTSNYDLLLSIDYALNQGARVLNMSWGSETPSQFLNSAMAYAQSKDVVLVAAAGNTATPQTMYPAAYAGVLAVGALGSDGQVWDQSNRGDFVALTAPGVAHFTVGYQGPPGAYAGTSIASAYVAHALALYLAKHPTATAAAAQSALLAAVTDVGAKGKDTLYGYGMLDAAALTRLLK
ncbi:MAG: S8 family serine peptidase [Kiritimatiellaeota bacterium]|nr:S8 family serine peptidase [Kiritimatiellota bacterium]